MPRKPKKTSIDFDTLKLVMELAIKYKLYKPYGEHRAKKGCPIGVLVTDDSVLFEDLKYNTFIRVQRDGTYTTSPDELWTPEDLLRTCKMELTIKAIRQRQKKSGLL